MKTLRFLSFAALAVLLSSCVEMTSVDNTDEQTNTIAAVMEGIQTKTSTTDEGRFSWSESDNIWLETTAGDVIGTLATGDGTPNATFNFGAFMGELTGRSVYPYNTGHSVEDDVLNVVLPASYNLGSNLENTNAPMYGVNVNGTLKFNHLAGVMRFAFKNVPAGVDKFTITVDKKINGLFEADLTADYPVLQTESTNVVEERTVTINFNAIANTSDIKLFIPLPLGTYESLELALYKGEEAIWNYSKAVTNTVNRKSLKLMPAVSMGGSIGGEIEGGDTPETPDETLYINLLDKYNGDVITHYETQEYKASYNGYIGEAIYVNTNVTEFIYEKPDWVSEVKLESYNGFEESYQWFTIAITANTNSEARQGTIKIIAKDNPDVYATIIIKQKGGEAYYLEGRYSLDVDAGAKETMGLVAGELNTNVTEFDIEKPEWIKDVYIDVNNTWSVAVWCYENTSTSPRSGQIKISAKNNPELYVIVNVSQYGADYYLKGNQYRLQVEGASATGKDNYTAGELNTNVTEFNIEKPDWVKNVYIDVNNTWTVVVWFNENTSTSPRSGEIKISAKNNPELFVIVYVSQVGA